MWLPDPPDHDGHLKQGDLLEEVPLLQVSARPEVDGSGRITNVKIKTCSVLVLSQCCTIEQRGVVQLARVEKTTLLAPTHGMYQALRSEWPASPGALMYDGMRLDPVGAALPELEEGRLWFANFRSGLTFVNNPVWLRDQVRARMTSVSRRNLRMRLAGFYARSTEDDAAELAGMGEWADSGDAPAWVHHPPSV